MFTLSGPLAKSLITVAASAVVATSAFAQTDGESLTGDLRIFLDTSNPAPRATMEAMIAEFQEMNPELNIETNVIDREAYKTQIRNFLTANAPDVATWYAGNRMLPFVEAGLFEDVSDLWDDEMSEALASTKPSMTIDGAQWGVPYTYYQWGVYYREDIFADLGLGEPTTWDEFLNVINVLNENDIDPVTIGTKFLWTAGGWFDYLNLRQNGYEFHMDLTNGEVAWTDQRVRDTFARWGELLEADTFIDNHAAYSWQEALPFMVNGDAAMYLMGNFAVAPLREAGLSDDQIGFFQFPEITEGIPMAEDAPTDTFHIPAQAENKDNARAFLRFVASADVQSEINSGANLGQLPVNANSTVDDDKFLNEGFEMLSNASALAQFFDRDAPAEVAAAAMEGFQQFMVQPEQLDNILDRLERVRQRVNGG
ncbi:multiple sugar transport system substrate-binding protein [Monaibacterium marinum]|uniref:Multiple sugar transport system substrate-binding protein n=1 Tax=Pontivivens marinum TaxID=1690039 RepID=A0A2C9CSD2_9RHOB|nr:extracellular solute-binding protein [Monaibacterium marinum]SOH94254.1 multiple sugar transport system substrate-binding protein [Monaibacterium marinum]